MQQFSVPAIVNFPSSGSLTDVLIGYASTQPNKPAIVRREGSEWIDLTSSQFLEEVRAVAKGFIASGIKPGDRIAIMSRTRFDWTITDYAIWYAGCVTVPIYETSSAEQMQWIISDSSAVAVIVESEANLEMLESIRSQVPTVAHTWIFDRGALAELRSAGAWISDADADVRRAAVTPNDTCTIIYTSGTTGRPKGCVVTHGNFAFLARNVIPSVPEVFGQPDTSTLLFLPLAHVFGRIIQIAMVESGLKLAFAPDIKNLVADLQAFKPNFLLAVPRVFEKVFNGAQQKAATEGKDKIFNLAADTAIDYSKAIATGNIGIGLRIKHAVFDKLVYTKLRAAMGGNVQWSVSGGAALGERLGHFFRGIGLTILEGYGLTETSSASTVNIPAFIKVGSVGRPIPGVTIRIADDGEILVQGPHIFQGYHNNEAATREAIDSDGWFHTGDIGRLDDEGYLFITGRKKELLVTAGGKNVAPAVIEDRLRADWLVGQCMVVGDGKPFIGCLITLDPESVPQWLKRHELSPTTPFSELSTNPDLISDIQTAVDSANQAVSKAESIRKWVLIDADWTIDSGHLTPSMKLKRNVVEDQYASAIQGLYDGATD